MPENLNGYNEYLPTSGLQTYLDCFWSYSTDASGILSDKKPIIPDGCIDIIFDMNQQDSLRSFVVGAMTKPIISSRTSLVGVRFKPGMAYPFINTPIHELTDLLVDYNEFAGHKADDLSDQLVNLKFTKHRIALLNSVFLKKLSFLNPVEAQMSKALSLIRSAEGHCSVTQISDVAGWSRQHFTRKCLWYTGLTPKFLTQVTRLNKVIRLYKTEPFYNWSQLSLEGGYYDQSHMINEFKKITGLTPIEFLS